MKSLAIIFIFMTTIAFTNNCYSQEHLKNEVEHSYSEILLKEKWATNYILGLDSNTSTYELTQYKPKGKFAGNITQFLDSSIFHSEYSAWCGNDNFTDVLGKYNFLGKDKIAIAVEAVSYSGEWTKPTEYRETKYFTFTISKIGDTLVLTKE